MNRMAGKANPEMTHLLQRHISRGLPSSCSPWGISPGTHPAHPALSLPFHVPPTRVTSQQRAPPSTLSCSLRDLEAPQTSPPLALHPIPHLALGARGVPCTAAGVAGSAPSQLGRRTPTWEGGLFLVMVDPTRSNHRCRPACHRWWLQSQKLWLRAEVGKSASSSLLTKGYTPSRGPAMTCPMRASRGTKSLPFLGLSLPIRIMGTNPCGASLSGYPG